MRVNIKINDKNHSIEIEPGEMLLETLRRLGYKGVKHACSTASCGACTVQIDGKPVLSCSTFTAAVDGHEVKTIEGFSNEGVLSEIQKAILEEGASQCGFCIPGLVVTAEALLKENPDPDQKEIIEYLKGNLCRCTGYESQTRAIMKAAKARRER
ncbi:(2Fe-2S)-binding protein [Athalassotoga saccharophila]|uniref:(2Fe-2S)-binding protein n=1 Tax=Athalassotoga saccharophila TaxID=1441386 RepID=UPI00137A94C2|nr:(2Fe-2S)-binding protein [Athalassotoga saccharophila]BBJ27415.1 aerobic-type carbon monoxide dehydrogenase, small subunit CoxS CutS-like protein [Athalassotoga saccharophila]